MKKQIEINGKKIFYSVSGNGKPVMLVHGFGEMASPNPSEGGALLRTEPTFRSFKQLRLFPIFGVLASRMNADVK
jgi:hypothetical protein